MAHKPKGPLWSFAFCDWHYDFIWRLNGLGVYAPRPAVAFARLLVAHRHDRG